MQTVPEGDDLQGHMHITPCRASRALALHFLALKSKLTMGYVQMVPEGDDLQSHMHITPCRASRALALRFLALKSELTMGNMTVVSLPARVTRQDEDKIRVTGHTSDLSELISGLCKVGCWPVLHTLVQDLCPMPLPASGHLRCP